MISLTHKDGRAINVYDLTFGRARLYIGQKNYMGYDDSW